MTFTPSKDLIDRLKKQAEIRNRKSAQDESDGMADLLEEAAKELEWFLPVTSHNGYPRTRCASCGSVHLRIIKATIGLRDTGKRNIFGKLKFEEVEPLPHIYCLDCDYSDDLQ